MSHVRHIGMALFLLAAAPIAGCYVEEGPPPVYAYGYTPQYYDGYVVYYDNVGRPFYHVGGAAVWVPADSPYYGGLVNHYHVYGQAYGHWYAHGGFRYRSYRGGGYRR